MRERVREETEMNGVRIGRSSSSNRLAAVVIVPIVALALAGGAIAVAQEQAPPVRAAPPEENITLEVPAGVALKIRGHSVGIRKYPQFTEHEISGGTTLTWGNGVKLTVRNAKVVVIHGKDGGPTRIFIRP